MPDTDMSDRIEMDLQEALRANFGHETFRPFQEQIIASVMEGQDVLCVLPTGAGKSLCYQLPALLLPRPTLVISPLIALMQDQIDGLPPAVYPQATLINSSIDYTELERRMAGIEAGEFRLIYAAPERLRQQSFLRLLQRVGLSLVVVDEAHCVSVWGHDFRPDYLFIRKALETLGEGGEPPILLALTATATPEMQGEIGGQLGRPLALVEAPAFRPNLRFEVCRCANADEKMTRLAALCAETPGAGIVYANSRDRCERLAAFLQSQGVSAAFYHAGLEREQRRATQEQFMLGRTRIMVATVAFGMGVDKSNVRLVVHFSLPGSLEAYTQEAGRAGRDGKPSRCVLLYAASDKANQGKWLRQEAVDLPTARDTYRALKARLGRGAGFISAEELLPDALGASAAEPGAETRLRVAISLLERSGMVARRPDSGRDLRIEMLTAPPTARADLERLLTDRARHAEERLAEMVGYADGGVCRHVTISAHFGQTLAPCGAACDLCLGTAESGPIGRPEAPTAEQTPDVGRIALGCVASLPFTLGRTGVAKVLTASADSPITADRCRHHGALAGFTLKAVRTFLDELAAGGLLRNDTEGEYPRIHLTQEGRTALQTDEMLLANPNRSRRSLPKVIDRRETDRKDTTRRAEGPATQPLERHETEPEEDDRFEQLRAWRRIEAERASVPPYVIFHDSTLRAIAAANPSTLDALSGLSGIGPRKLELYGAAVLDLLHGAET
jgi:ATP-dependent DNA helicase RecQ